MYSVIARIMRGKSVVGYKVGNARSGKEHNINKKTLAELIMKKQVDNVTMQHYNGSILFRGTGIDMNKLPIIGLDEKGAVVKEKDGTNCDNKVENLQEMGIIKQFYSDDGTLIYVRKENGRIYNVRASEVVGILKDFGEQNIGYVVRCINKNGSKAEKLRGIYARVLLRDYWEYNNVTIGHVNGNEVIRVNNRDVRELPVYYIDSQGNICKLQVNVNKQSVKYKVMMAKIALKAVEGNKDGLTDLVRYAQLRANNEKSDVVKSNYVATEVGEAIMYALSH